MKTAPSVLVGVGVMGLVLFAFSRGLGQKIKVIGKSGTRWVTSKRFDFRERQTQVQVSLADENLRIEAGTVGVLTFHTDNSGINRLVNITNNSLGQGIISAAISDFSIFAPEAKLATT